MADRLDALIKSLLAAAGDNAHLAQRELIKRVMANDMLLRELVAPFLAPIALKRIERVKGQTLRVGLPPLKVSAHPSIASEQDPSSSVLSTNKAGLQLQSPGYNPMVASTSLQEAPARPSASSRHISTIKLLAAAYAVKRGERV